MITDVVPSNIPLDNVFIPAIANGLASLGRFEDTYMVHAAKGETVIPKQVLDANPGLKEKLFQQMVDMGIENPQRYVVGEDLNSINPITGQPEFFWDSIKEFFVDAAPAIGGAVGGYFGGTFGAAAGAGLGSKLAGKTTEEALMAAALAGGTRYLLGSGSPYGENVQGKTITEEMYNKGLGDYATRAQELAGTSTGGLLSTGYGQALRSLRIPETALASGQLGSGIAGGLGGALATYMSEDPEEQSAANQARTAASRQRQESVGNQYRQILESEGKTESRRFPGTPLAELTPEQLALMPPPESLLENLRRRGKVTQAVPTAAEQALINANLNPNLLTQGQSKSPARTVFPLNVETLPMYAQQGGVVPGDTSQNQDTVPAMLTPGEFVFTQDAVRGAAPNGSRQQQARAMYDIMRGLEGRA
jgi:hypothetical protein|tara:strand:+ start:38 stop:1297 length:1260 start_codon:yes stop_codon:yes gene_type:complete